MLGGAQLVPHWMLSGHDAILAVDIGGTNMRAGVVALEWRKRVLVDARITDAEIWRHRDDEPGRDEAVAKLVDMLRGLIKSAEKKQRNLAPFIGIGCPGIINEDGTIERGGQNLPGNWEAARFNLPRHSRGDPRDRRRCDPRADAQRRRGSGPQ
ncbi:MAG: hypothetical protein WDN25_30885 [Acetobacteraceae bacterium]